jgi:hypothetical protein
MIEETKQKEPEKKELITEVKKEKEIVPDKTVILKLINGKWEAEFSVTKGYFSVVDLSRIAASTRHYFRLYQHKLKVESYRQKKS